MAPVTKVVLEKDIQNYLKTCKILNIQRFLVVSSGDFIDNKYENRILTKLTELNKRLKD